MSEDFDVIVVGTGAAGLSAALSAEARRARGCWSSKRRRWSAARRRCPAAASGPASPLHGREMGLSTTAATRSSTTSARSRRTAGTIREEPLWAAFVDHVPGHVEVPRSAQFTTDPLHTQPRPRPLREGTGSLPYGRNVSAAPIRLGILGAWRDKVRNPTFDLRLNYEELVDTHLLRPAQAMDDALHAAYRLAQAHEHAHAGQCPFDRPARRMPRQGHRHLARDAGQAADAGSRAHHRPRSRTQRADRRRSTPRKASSSRAAASNGTRK